METRIITVDEPDWYNDQWREGFIRDRRAEGWTLLKAEPIPDRPQLTVTFTKAH